MTPYGDIDASKVDSSGGSDLERMKEKEKGEFAFFFALQKLCSHAGLACSMVVACRCL